MSNAFYYVSKCYFFLLSLEVPIFPLVTSMTIQRSWHKSIDGSDFHRALYFLISFKFYPSRITLSTNYEPLILISTFCCKCLSIEINYRESNVILSMQRITKTKSLMMERVSFFALESTNKYSSHKKIKGIKTFMHMLQ